jgi:hypothetical protein
LEKKARSLSAASAPNHQAETGPAPFTAAHLDDPFQGRGPSKAQIVDDRKSEGLQGLNGNKM